MDHKFNSGTILSQTFSVFFSNFAAFGLICLLILSPTLVVQAWMGIQQFNNPTEISFLPFVVLILLGLLTPIATGALSYGVFQQVRGKHASVSDCLTVGFKRLLPVLGVGILAGLIQGLGTLMCLVPGIIAATILAAAVPAAVIERPGVTGALSRSAELTKGYRWTVFGVIFGLAILQFIANMAIGVLATLSLYALLGGTAVSTIIFTGLQATAPTLIYYHLRKAKESIDVEEIAAVFD
jgi:hypothetical protein